MRRAKSIAIAKMHCYGIVAAARLLPAAVRTMDCKMPGVTVAVLDTFHPQIKAAVEAAVPADWTLRFVDENSFAARVTLIREADIVFVMAAPMPKEMLAEARALPLIQKLGAGVDRIDLDFCRAHGIGVTQCRQCGSGRRAHYSADVGDLSPAPADRSPHPCRHLEQGGRARHPPLAAA